MTEADQSSPPTPNQSETVRRYRRFPVLLALLFVPWTVVFVRGYLTAILPIGLLGFDPVQLTTVYDYYIRYTGTLPQYLTAYGVSVLLYLVAVGSALLGLRWREDGRVTAALLVFAGGTHLWVTLGFLRRPGYLALPVGTVACWLVAWRYYRQELRRMFPLSDM